MRAGEPDATDILPLIGERSPHVLARAAAIARHDPGGFAPVYTRG